MAGISRAKSNALAAEEAAKQDALKKRAARQAAQRLIEPGPAAEVVECVVLPQGADKISMGSHIGGLGEAHYEEGETFSIELPIAVKLYDRGYVNFEGGRAASDEARSARRQEIAAQIRADAEIQAALDA